MNLKGLKYRAYPITTKSEIIIGLEVNNSKIFRTIHICKLRKNQNLNNARVGDMTKEVRKYC